LINVKVELNRKDLALVQSEFDKIKKAIDSKELNLHRASSYKEYTRTLVSSGNVRLLPLSSATIFLTGVHNPEFLTGKLIDEMQIASNADKSATAGYWEPSKKVPKKSAGKDITYAHLALIQHTGYRIPLTGPDGERVRKWLAAQKLGSSNSGRNKKNVKSIVAAGKWIIVPPRPFMTRSLDRYLEEDMDSKAVKNYIDRVLK